MKKKIAIFALAFSSLNVFAWEANIRAGFDFFRNYQEIIKPGEKDKIGFTLGAEVIPFNKGIFELGVGSEYNFGLTSVVYSGEDNAPKFFIPIYAVSHLNLYRNSDNSGSIYLLNRLGGVVYKKGDDPFKGGLYYGVGLGADFKAFTAEILYDGAWIPKNKTEEQMQNKVGIRLGFKVGDYMTKAPVVKKEIVKPMVEEPKMEEPKVEEIKVPETIIEMPKVEEVKVEKPKMEEPKVEEVKVEKPKMEEPKVEEVKVEEPKIEEPKVEETIVEMPKVEKIKPVEEVKPMEKTIEVAPIEEVAPVVVEDVKPVIEEVELPEFIHGNCATETKICTIFGFKVDGKIPNAEEKKALEEIVEVVNNFAKAGKVEVVGNTDSTGSIKYNQKLSEKRAENIARLLKEYGLKESIEIVNIKGNGELKPIDTNKTKLGRYNNRRVELIFLDLDR